ncbi:MAG: hypothetical protein ACRDPW_10105 [Mycobacteriales bacterium]
MAGGDGPGEAAKPRRLPFAGVQTGDSRLPKQNYPGWLEYGRLVAARITVQGRNAHDLARYVGCEWHELAPLWSVRGPEILHHIAAVTQFCVDNSRGKPATAEVPPDGWRHFGELSRRLREGEGRELDAAALALEASPDQLRQVEAGEGVQFPELVASIIRSYGPLGRDITSFGPEERTQFVEALRLRAGGPSYIAVAAEMGVRRQHLNAALRGGYRNRSKTLSCDYFLRILQVLRAGIPDGVTDDDLLHQLGYPSFRDLVPGSGSVDTARSEGGAQEGLGEWLRNARLVCGLSLSDAAMSPWSKGQIAGRELCTVSVEEAYIRHIHDVVLQQFGEVWQASPHYVSVDGVLAAFAGRYQPTDLAPKEPLTVAEAAFVAEHHKLVEDMVTRWARGGGLTDPEGARSYVLEKLVTLARVPEHRESLRRRGLVIVVVRRSLINWCRRQRTRSQVSRPTSLDPTGHQDPAAREVLDTLLKGESLRELVRDADLTDADKRALELGIVQDRPHHEVIEALVEEFGLDEAQAARVLPDALRRLRVAAGVLPAGPAAGMFSTAGDDTSPTKPLSPGDSEALATPAPSGRPQAGGANPPKPGSGSRRSVSQHRDKQGPGH